MNLPSMLSHIASLNQLPPSGVHGLCHWGRALENRLRLADMEGGDASGIILFSIFHDVCRFNQSIDPGHGIGGLS